MGGGGVGQGALAAHTPVGAYKARVAASRGKNIGTVAAARKQVEFVFHALRDHHVRALHRPARPPAGRGAGMTALIVTAGREAVQVMTPGTGVRAATSVVEPSD